MSLQTDALVELWGEPLGRRPDRIHSVSSDSRSDLKGALFVPLVGERFDGHQFLDAARIGGAAAAVAQRDRLSAERVQALAREGNWALWLVEDTLVALQELARVWRRQSPAAIVAVTGSAGKTTTRELIRAALGSLGEVVASRGNENNDVGAPGTLLRATPQSAALVVEMGMRGLGEIERLSRCAEPDVAVITNIGTAHIGRLGSREAIAQAKCEITAALQPGGLVVIPAGDPLLEQALAAVWSGSVERVALADEIPQLAASTPPPTLVGTLLGTEGSEGTAPSLRLSRPGEEALPLEAPPLTLPLDGRHNARNMLLAIATALHLGVNPADLRHLEVQLPGGRSRRLSVGGVCLLDETYNASPEAVLASLELLAAGGGRRYAVLGTMLELGERSLELHGLVARRVQDLGLDGLVIVADGAEGDAMAAAAAGLPRLRRVTTPEAAAEPLLPWLVPGDTVLLKASRGVALERLIPILEQGLSKEALPSA